MKPARYFTLPVLVLTFVSSTSAQQNSRQVNVSSVVTCVSTADQRQHCTANTSAGIVMLRQSSETSCLLGRNWGYDAQGVWVSEGCGGELRHRQHIALSGDTSRSECGRSVIDEYLPSVSQFNRWVMQYASDIVEFGITRTSVKASKMREDGTPMSADHLVRYASGCMSNKGRDLQEQAVANG